MGFIKSRPYSIGWQFKVLYGVFSPQQYKLSIDIPVRDNLIVYNLNVVDQIPICTIDRENLY